MRDSTVSYGRLDEVLVTLGFSVHVEQGKHCVYAHEPTGALVTLPDRNRSELVSAAYLAAARKVLSDYGIANELEFASQLQKAS